MGVFSRLFSWKKSEKKFDFYDEKFEFNTKWVSLNYQGQSTASIIERLNPGDRIILQWSPVEFRGEHIKVFSPDKKQIGWVPSVPGYRVYDLLVQALQARWPMNAYVKKTGPVNDPSKNIWWCAVVVEFKIQYLVTGDEVFIARKRYHSDENCGTTKKKKVPLSVAKECGCTPCPRCMANQLLKEKSKITE